MAVSVDVDLIVPPDGAGTSDTPITYRVPRDVTAVMVDPPETTARGRD